MDHKQVHNDIFNTTECPSDALLLSYVKGTVTASEKRMVELHLVDCEMCSDMVEGYQNMAPHQISTHIKSIEKRIDEVVAERKENKAGAAGFKWYYAAAAVLIIGLTGILYQYYFNTLEQTQVADLPKKEESKEVVVIDSVEKNEIPPAPAVNATEVNEIVVPLVQKHVPIVAQSLAEDNDDVDMSKREMATESPAAKTPKLEEKAAAEPAVVVKEDLNSTITSANNNVTLNTVSPTSDYTWTPSQGVTSQGATPNYTSPTTNFDSESTISLESNKFLYDTKKVEKSTTKSKKNVVKPNALEKRLALKESEETVATKGKASADEKVDILQVAMQLYENQQYESALLNYNQYLKSSPTNCDAMYGAAQCYDALNKIAEAIVQYSKLTKVNCAKQTDEAHLKLGMLYIKNNQKQEAKIAFQKAQQSKYSEIAEQAKKELEKL